MKDDSSSSRKKIIIYAGVVLSIAFAILLFVLGMMVLMPVFDNYFHETKEISNLYDFYDQGVDDNQTSIFFVGPSQIGDAVYPEEIHRILAENGYGNVSVYNLYISGEGPLDEVLQVQNIINLHPALVIIGVTNAVMSAESPIEDNILIVQDRLQVRNDSLYLYSESDQDLLKRGINLWELKRFIRSALTAFFTEGVRGYTQTYDYSTDPIGDASVRIAKTEFRKANVDLSYLNTTDEFTYPVSNRSLEALNYIQKTLKDTGIDTVVVTMPENPLYSEKIADASRVEYSNALNTTVCGNLYDLEYALNGTYFVDAQHTTFDGAVALAPIWAKIIMNEFEDNNAVYNT